MSPLEELAYHLRPRARMVGAVVIMAGLGVGLWTGGRDLKMSIFSKRSPQTIPASQFVREGPGNNLHVLVTEYSISPEGIKDEDFAWFIVYPNSPQQGDASLLVKIKRGKYGASVPADGLQGMAYNGSHTLNVDMRSALKKLGRVEFDHLWVVEHDRQPPPGTSASAQACKSRSSCCSSPSW